MTATTDHRPLHAPGQGDDLPSIWADDQSAPTTGPSITPADAPEQDDSVMMLVLAGLAVAGGAVLAGIGFTGSYNTLRHLAQAKGFGAFSYAFPVGIDCGILVLLAIDLFLMRKRMAKPMLRWAAHVLTAVTVVFNAAASGPIMRDPLASAMHAVIPVLFVWAVEAARHYIGRRADLLAGQQELGSVPPSRWFLSPVRTPRVARRMRLYNLPYADVVTQDQQLSIYQESLRQKYAGRPEGWKKAATPEEMLPFKLARFGFSVEQALAEPMLEKTRRIQREAAAALQQAQAQIQMVEADVQIRTARIQAEVDQIRADGELELARTEAQQAAKARIQQAEAAFQVAEAERQAELELVQERAQARADELADESAKRREQARIDREKAQVSWRLEQARMESELTGEERRQQAESELRAAVEEAERKAATAELERQAAEAEAARLKAEEQAAESSARAAEHRAREMKAAADEQRSQEEAAAFQARTAASHRTVAEHLAHVAEFEARAVEAAARARMSQVDWDVQRVAAMIRARGAEAVTVRVIEAELGVSAGTAHDRKQRALQLLENGGEVLVQDAA